MSNIEIFKDEKTVEDRITSSLKEGEVLVSKVTIYDGEVFYIKQIGKEYIGCYEHNGTTDEYTMWEMLALAYDCDDDETARKIMLMSDAIMVDNPYYWLLRDAVMTAREAWELQKERAYIRSKCKTYLMKDENTGYTKIGRSSNPNKREQTLQSEKPTISLFMICDKCIEKELHDFFAIKHIRGEWYNLNQKDFDLLKEKYNFKDV